MDLFNNPVETQQRTIEFDSSKQSIKSLRALNFTDCPWIYHVQCFMYMDLFLKTKRTNKV